MKWNERLKKAREDKGLTKAELSRLLKVSGPTVTEWENGGITTISGPNLIKVCKVLGITESWLLHGIEPASGEPVKSGLAAALDLQAKTAKEQRLLTAYRLADEAGQLAFDHLTDAMIDMLHGRLGDQSQSR